MVGPSPRGSLTGRGPLGNLGVVNFHLRVRSGLREGERIALPSGASEPLSVTIGRGSEAGVRFPDQTMSRTHAVLRWADGGWLLENRSQHGSYVGRKHLTGERRRRLRPGDRLLLGETELVFEADGLDATPPATLTPQTPTVARAPTLAGYDTQGKFHSGHTLVEASDPGSSFIQIGLVGGEQGLRFKKRRLYFLAVLCVLGAIGGAATGYLIVWPALTAHPRQMLVAALFGLLPALPYLLLFKFLDRNGQVPWRNLLACTVWGATAGCGAALVLNSLGNNALTAFVGARGAWSLTAIFLAPVTEEVVKGMAVLVVFWILHDEFDNALEGLILGAASGLGFAVVENCIYNVGFLQQGSETLLVMGTYRALVNALIGHPIYTAMTGAGLGLLREAPRAHRRRFLYAPLGLVTAVGMHVVWNAAALTFGEVFGPERGVLALALNTAVFGGAGLLFFAAAYVFAARRERRVLVTYLSEEVDKGFVEKEELASFSRWFGRLRYELGGLFAHGPRGYSLRRGLRRAQVDLAFRKWHLAQGDAVRGTRVDAYVRDARERIRDARNALNQLEGAQRA